MDAVSSNPARWAVKHGRCHGVALILMFLGTGCEQQSTPQAPVTVLAAASTTELIEDAARAFEKSSGKQVRISFGASATLARQIEAGAPCDVFVSADPRWVDELERKGLLASGMYRDLMGNELVLIAAFGKRPVLRFEPSFDFAGAFTGKLAMGDPSHVPAGMYARQALQRLGWWAAISERVIPAADVRQVVRLVEQGEATLGIVYRTDITACRDCTEVGLFPPGLHDPIRYVAALCKDSRDTAFYSFLNSTLFAEMFRRHGFTPIVPATSSAAAMHDY